MKNNKKVKHIKELLFVFYMIMNEGIMISPLLSDFIIYINSIQIFGIIFFVAKLHLRSFNIFNNIITEFLNIFTPIFLSNMLSINFYYDFFLYLFSLFLIFQIIYMLIVFKKMEKYELVKYDDFDIFMLKFYKIANYLFNYLFYLPQLTTYLFVVKCFFSNETQYFENLSFNEYYTNKCDLFNLVYFLLIVFLLILFLIFHGLSSLLNFHIETQKNNGLACSYSPFHVIYMFYQIFLCLMIIDSRYYPLMNFVLIILQLVLISILLNYHVFHNPYTEKKMFMIISAELSVVCYFEIMYIFENYTDTKNIEFFNIGLLFVFSKILKICKLYYENYIDKLITQEVTEIKFDSMVDKKIKFHLFFTLDQQIQKNDITYKFNDFPSFLIRGYFDYHCEHCKFVDCLCKNSKKFVYDYTVQEDYIINKEKKSKNLSNLIYIKHLLNNQYYAYCSTKRKKDVYLRINMAGFLFFQLRNFNKTVVECIDMKLNSNPNILQQIPLNRLMRRIDIYQYNLDKNKFNFPDYSVLSFHSLMRIENNYMCLKSEIKTFIDDYINFLNELLQDHPNITKMEQQSFHLYNKRLEIDRIFQRNCENPVSIRLYMEYLSNLLFSDDLKKGYEKKYAKKLELILSNISNGKIFFQLDLLYNEESIICQMGSSKNNLGHIIKANEGMAKFVGYTIAELEFTNINILMPERIAVNHDMYLLNFMESSKGNVIYRERKIFARNKDGFIQFSSILMKPLYDYSSDIYKFVAYMQPFGQGIEFAVVDENGFIDCISKGLGSIMNMIPENYENKKLLIQSVSPNLAEIFLIKLLNEERIKDQEIESRMKQIKGIKLDNGDFLCKVYPYLNGVENYRNLLDRITNKIIKKEYKDIIEYLDEWIVYKQLIDEEISEQNTFILQATQLILYNVDKTLEMNIFCFKEVDSIYLEIPQKIYAEASMIKNLEYFLSNKNTVLTKNNEEIKKVAQISFYNSKTFMSALSRDYDSNEEGNSAKDLNFSIPEKKENEEDDEESDENIVLDDISLHMNKQLDLIFANHLKTKKKLDLKTDNQMKKNNGVIINDQVDTPDIDNYTFTEKSQKTENEIQFKIETNVNSPKLSENETNKSKLKSAFSLKSLGKIKEKSLIDLWKVKTPITSPLRKAYNNMKNKTFGSKINVSLNINDNHQLIKRPTTSEDHNFTKNSEDGNKNRIKEKKIEEIKKFNKQLFNDGKGSSIGSSTTANIQARKSLRESIDYNYLPNSFHKIILLFTISTSLIFISQAISTIFLRNSINELSTNLKADGVYQEISFKIIRIANSFYKWRLMSTIYPTLVGPINGVYRGEIRDMIEIDSYSLISDVEFIENNYALFKNVCYEIYNDEFQFTLLKSNLTLRVLRSITLFIANSLYLVKNNINETNITKISDQQFFILKNANSLLTILQNNNKFDIHNTDTIKSIKSLMIIIFSATCSILLILFIIRIFLYKTCYDYTNLLFLMFGSIANEDLTSLLIYLREIKTVFENTFLNIKINNEEEGENVDNFNKKKSWALNNSDKDLKNQRGVQQRRTKIFINLHFPLSKILFINLVWYLIFFCGYVGLLGISNILDDKLENSVTMRKNLRNEQYIMPAQSLFYSYDYIAYSIKDIYEPFAGLNTDEFKKFIDGNFQNKLNEFELSSNYFEELFNLLHNTSVCVNLNNTGNKRFFSKNYCNNLLDGMLKIGILPFLKNFFNFLEQLDFNKESNKTQIINKLKSLKISDYVEALEYIIWPLNDYKLQYEESETNNFNEKLMSINIFIILELLSIAFLLYVYWICYLYPLKKRLFYARKSFFHIPFAVLSQQPRIVKYINSTGNILLKK